MTINQLNELVSNASSQIGVALQLEPTVRDEILLDLNTNLVDVLSQIPLNSHHREDVQEILDCIGQYLY